MDPVNQPSPDDDLDAPDVARLKAGDVQALGPIYSRHGAPVRSLLLRTEPRLGPPGAEDLAQEVFLTFMDTLDRYRHEGKLRSWLYGIAVRKARSWRRRRWVRWSLSQQHGEQASGVALLRDRTEDRIAAHRRVEAILASLPAKLREVAVLKFVEEMSAREISQVLDISENAVNIRVHRVRRHLEEETR